MNTDFAGHEIDLLSFAEDGALSQIDDAVPAERRNARAGPRVERDEAVSRRDVEDAFVPAIGPVGDASARQLARRRGRTRALVLAVGPPQLARDRVERDDGAARAGGRVDDSVDFERRAFELELRTRTEAVGLEAPRDFERVEIRRVDLRKPRVVLMLQVSRVRAPFDVRGIAGGPLRAGSDRRGEDDDDGRSHRTP